VTIASVAGERVTKASISYQASKAALIHLTRRMAARLVKDHIYVTSLAPGAFPSNMNKAARDHEERSAAGIPSKRVGDKWDMGGTAVYLASRAGDYTIGETVTVDGGIVNAHLPSHFAEPA
jgi:NAD(P)-dependent dehydrogenase (short-subunit alcohol dehydrogenase family)